MSEVLIKYPDGNIGKHIKQNGIQMSLRSIFTECGQNLPDYEFCVLIDEKLNQPISKKSELNPSKTYKLVDLREILRSFNFMRQKFIKQTDDIAKLQEIIQKSQELLQKEQKSISDQEKQSQEDLKTQITELELINQKLEKENNQYSERLIQDQKKQEERINQELNRLIQNQKQQEEKNKQEIERLIQDQKKLEEKNQKLKEKYKSFHKQILETLEAKSKYESEIASLKKDVQYKDEKIKEKEDQLKKLEDKCKEELQSQQKNFDQQFQREGDRSKSLENRLKSLDEKYEKMCQEVYRDKINSSQNINSEQSVDLIKENYEKIQFNLENEIQKLNHAIQDLDAKNKKTSQELEKILFQNRTLNQENEKLKFEKLENSKQIEERDIRIKNLLQVINEEDQQFIQINHKVEQLEINLDNSFRYRLTRLIELIPRNYKDEINFALQEFIQQKKYQAQGNLVDKMYYVYEIQLQQQQQKIYEKIFSNSSNLDIRSTIDLKYHKNFHGQLSQEKIVCETIDNNKNKLVDSLQLYFCNSFDRIIEPAQIIATESCQKIYIIKESYENWQEEHLLKEKALDILCGSIVAQQILDKFVKELQDKKINIPCQFKFAHPVLLMDKISFKKFFLEMIQNTNLNQAPEVFKNTVIQLCHKIDEENSNDFYYHIRDLQLRRPKDQQQNDVQKQQALFLSEFIELCFENEKRGPYQGILNVFKSYQEEERLKAFNYLTELLSDVYAEFPIENFYPAYEINLNDIHNNEFQKYNGGNAQFDDSEIGKFFSALSFYSLKRTHYQFCVSHIQGIGNTLYDPMVSSYDGFLNCFDQGKNEMQNIESAFISSDPDKVGTKYIKALGILIE